MTAIIETVLPEPDSPTTPSTPPTGTSSEIPATACTRPSSVANETRRSRTSSSGVASGEADTWIEPGIDEVDECVDEDDEEGRVHHARHDHRQVEVLERVVRELADAVEPEDDL